jgi:hypothetical protein
MTSDYEAWQEQYTFKCPHMSARITPEQCDYNRTRQNDGKWGRVGAETRPSYHCEKCTEHEELKATVQKRLPYNLEDKSMSNKTGRCKGCQAPHVKLYTRNLCIKCKRHFDAGDIEQLESGQIIWVAEPLPDYVIEQRTANRSNRTAVDLLKEVQAQEDQKKKQERALEKAEAVELKPDPEVKEELKRNPPSRIRTGDGLHLVRHTGSPAAPQVPFAALSISERAAEICLNVIAVDRFDLDKASHVDLFHDAEAQVIALRPLMEPTDKHSVSLRRNKRDRRLKVSVRSLLKELGFNKPGRYKVTDSDVAGVVLVHLGEEAA